LCQAIVKLFALDEGKWKGKIAKRAENATYEKATKNSWDLEILNKGAWQPIFQEIHPRIEACLFHYLKRSPVLQ